MSEVGCTLVTDTVRGNIRVLVGVPLPSGELQRFDCTAVAFDSVGAAVRTYWSAVGPHAPMHASAVEDLDAWYYSNEPSIPLGDAPIGYRYEFGDRGMFCGTGGGDEIPGSWTLIEWLYMDEEHVCVLVKWWDTVAWPEDPRLDTNNGIPGDSTGNSGSPGSGGWSGGPSLPPPDDSENSCPDDEEPPSGGELFDLLLEAAVEPVEYVHGPFVPEAGNAESCGIFQSCVKDASGQDLLDILLYAKDPSNNWAYTQGGDKGGIEPAKNMTTRHGDCTDFVWDAASKVLGSRWPHAWGSRPGTSNFKRWVHDSIRANMTPAEKALQDLERQKIMSRGYRRVPSDSAMEGDVVVQGGHAGIYLGDGWRASSGTKFRDSTATYGWANNGLPATDGQANGVDGTTGPARFDNPGKGETFFFRPQVKCTP